MPGTSASKKSAFSGTAVLAIVTAGVLLAGCASKNSAAGSGGNPPKLLIGTGTSAGTADAPMMAAGVAPGAAVAPQPAVGHFAGFGGYVLAGTLPTEPTHAPIWTWQSGKASESDVTKLASALGLSGTPQRHAFGWELSTSAGDLRVRDTDGEQWSYNRADTVPCPAYQTDIDNADGVSVGVGCAVFAPPIPPGASPPTPAPAPDEAATKTAAASLLEALGVTGDEQFNASDPVSTLTVAPQIDGMPTQGIETNVDVDAKGIRAATGRLVAPKSGDDYPLQTATAAFKSLADRPMPMIAMYCGPVRGGPVLPVPAASGPNTKFPLNPSASDQPAPVASGPNTKFPLNPAASASPNTVLVASPPPAPVSGPAIDSAGPIAVPPVESAYPCPTPKPQKVTGAVIGLQVQYNATGATTTADGSSSGGSNILVPTWFFTVEGSTDPLTVIAVDPSFLGDQFPIPPVGAPAASTSAGFSGSGGGSAGSGTVAVPPSGPVLPPTPAAKS
ncbi:MAG TPA: hypothetical protein VIJ31_00055 [Acidothermaceae bacterium]